ncbi:MAG: hypothetical protein CMP57_03910 [Flavobacteriales bacterium]|nr:hypothetical protein [Flavobacteriales bacterium]|tara:strand:+ start:338 stop:769 length:432 start_codon:yes stop_codon:yes gene_type:complete
MVKLLELDIPDFYIKEPLTKSSIEILKKDKSKKDVVKRLFMIKNEVKPDYYFAETGPETGFFLTATVQPDFVLIGDARRQIKEEDIWADLLKERPLYKIKVKVYLEKEYELFWEFEHITKNKNEIYKLIIDLKHKIENIIKEK